MPLLHNFLPNHNCGLSLTIPESRICPVTRWQGYWRWRGIREHWALIIQAHAHFSIHVALVDVHGVYTTWQGGLGFCSSLQGYLWPRSCLSSHYFSGQHGTTGLLHFWTWLCCWLQRYGTVSCSGSTWPSMLLMWWPSCVLMNFCHSILHLNWHWDQSWLCPWAIISFAIHSRVPTIPDFTRELDVIHYPSRV